jgi:hypothetical protein
MSDVAAPTWLAEANSTRREKGAGTFEGRPLSDEGRFQNPYFGITADHGVFIVSFADGAIGLRVFPVDDPGARGWACDAPPGAAGALAFPDLLLAFVQDAATDRAAKLRWVDVAEKVQLPALFVGKYRGKRHKNPAGRRTFVRVDARFVLDEPIGPERTAALSAAGARLTCVRVDERLGRTLRAAEALDAEVLRLEALVDTLHGRIRALERERG